MVTAIAAAAKINTGGRRPVERGTAPEASRAGSLRGPCPSATTSG